MSDGPDDDDVVTLADTLGDESFADPVASRLDAIGVLLHRVASVEDPELRALGKQAIEKGIRTIPTARGAKVLSVVR